jgi:hypothetical protein
MNRKLGTRRKVQIGQERKRTEQFNARYCCLAQDEEDWHRGYGGRSKRIDLTMKPVNSGLTGLDFLLNMGLSGSYSEHEELAPSTFMHTVSAYYFVRGGSGIWP